MRGPLRATLPALAAIAAALLVPSKAPAAVNPVLGGNLTPQAEFSVKASHGYTLDVERTGRKVTLTAGNRYGFASYTVLARPSRTAIDARFGSLGRVSVRFKPSGRVRVERPPKGCSGKARVTRLGTFVGTIRFAGERGYTRVDAGRAPGRIHSSARWKCPRSPGKPPPSLHEPGASFEQPAGLVASATRRRLAFAAGVVRLPEKPEVTVFDAVLAESRGELRIFRAVLVLGPEGTFIPDAALSTVTVAPPAPFSGTATFKRNLDGSTSWTGSLSVSFPGAANVALTGPGFRVSLFRP